MLSVIKRLAIAGADIIRPISVNLNFGDCS